MNCTLEGCGTTARCTRPDCPHPAAERRIADAAPPPDGVVLPYSSLFGAARQPWSAPHSWAEAHALGWTEYLWASVEVQRAHVEALAGFPR